MQLVGELNRIYSENCKAFRVEISGEGLREMSSEADIENMAEVLDAIKLLVHSSEANKMSMYT
jgi:hypothetical protein